MGRVSLGPGGSGSLLLGRKPFLVSFLPCLKELPPPHNLVFELSKNLESVNFINSLPKYDLILLNYVEQFCFHSSITASINVSHSPNPSPGPCL